jgi:hypothetical protein
VRRAGAEVVRAERNGPTSASVWIASHVGGELRHVLEEQSVPHEGERRCCAAYCAMGEAAPDQWSERADDGVARLASCC